MKRFSCTLAVTSVRFITVATAAIIALTTASTSHAAVAYGIDGNGNLRLITSLGSMSSVILGSTPFASGGINVGLAIGPSGQLFAGDAGGNIYSLTASHLATGNHLDWTAFAISLDVPEPTSAWLIAIGCGTALLRRKRRHL